MELEIKDKVAVVTGASEGLGKAIALGLGQEGARVAISARRSEQLDSAASDIRDQTGADVLAITGDMSAKANVETFIGAVVDKWDTVHVLVNNVGRATRGKFADLSQDEWRDALDANLFSAIYCTELALPLMRRQRWGRIINIAAVSAKEPPVGLLASNVAKSGMLSFSKTLAGENITVNSILPGRILTPQLTGWWSVNEIEKIAEAQIPAKRFGSAEELANLVVFMASERASYITGSTIPVDGGMSKGLY